MNDIAKELTASDYAVVVDGHVHMYPCFSEDELFDNAFEHLTALLPPNDSTPRSYVLLLAERFDCHYFEAWAEGRWQATPSRFRISSLPDPNALRLERSDGASALIVAGRQIVTAERLEVLAIGTCRTLPDGLPAEAVLEQVHAEGLVPVLPWSPGKWTGKRGRLIAEWLRAHSPGDFLLADSSLRPTGWPEPKLLRNAAQAGFSIIAGSDPLPIRGEEREVGLYGFRFQSPFDPERPAQSLRRILLDPQTRIERVGRRNSLLRAGTRLSRLMLRPSRGML